MRKPALRKPNTGGFSLMEMVVVMAVITILVGMALPSLSAYARNAKEIERSDHEELVGKAIRQYYAYEGDYPDITSIPNDANDYSKLLDATDVAELRDALAGVTSARINVTDYDYRYNESTGEISLALT